jgi:hypothetical protein
MNILRIYPRSEYTVVRQAKSCQDRKAVNLKSAEAARRHRQRALEGSGFEIKPSEVSLSDDIAG